MTYTAGTGPRARTLQWLARRLPPCEAVTRLVSESFERQLTIGEQLRKALHQLVCEGCIRFERHLRILRRSFRLYASEVGGGKPASSRAYAE